MYEFLGLVIVVLVVLVGLYMAGVFTKSTLPTTVAELKQAEANVAQAASDLKQKPPAAS